MTLARALSLAAAALALALAAGSALAGDAAGAEPPSPELERLKALAGEWTGVARGHGSDRKSPTVASIRVVSAGSAVMLVTDPGTPHEMVTMFHRDDGALLATHYCAAMNQPRMRAQPAKEPDRLVFEFVDGTNLKAHPGHMQRLTLRLSGPDRHVQEWTFAAGDKTDTMVFVLDRKR